MLQEQEEEQGVLLEAMGVVAVTEEAISRGRGSHLRDSRSSYLA